MPRNDDGEFELILGNKQLLSVFFIVIILLGVFFTMGYIVGRNSGPADTAKRSGPDGANPARTDGQSAMAPTTPQSAPTASPTVVDPVEQKAAETPAAAAPPPVKETPK